MTYGEGELSDADSWYACWESALGFGGSVAWTAQQVNVKRSGWGPLPLQPLGPAYGAS